jgi:hypothetical protein
MSSGKRTEVGAELVRDALLNEVDDVLRGSAGKKDFGDAGFLQAGNVRLGNDAAEKNRDIIHAFVMEQAHQLRAKRVVRAGENGEADHVDIFLYGGRGDHLGRLAQASVDHFHAGVAERASDDLGAAVVAVEAGLGNQHPNFVLWH